jgi:hypothetical protein
MDASTELIITQYIVKRNIKAKNDLCLKAVFADFINDSLSTFIFSEEAR